jgi:hypothetical protein
MAGISRGYIDGLRGTELHEKNGIDILQDITIVITDQNSAQIVVFERELTLISNSSTL